MEALRADALRLRDWQGFLALFGSHERLCAFEQVSGDMDDAQFWANLRDVWSGAEFMAPDLDRWERLLFSSRPCAGAAAMMDAEERARLAKLPDRLTIYRGQQRETDRLGFSWTLNRERAAWFASTRGHDRLIHLSRGTWRPGPGVVLCGSVRRASLLCFLADRGEDEVLVRPEHVQEIRFEAP